MNARATPDPGAGGATADSLRARPLSRLWLWLVGFSIGMVVSLQTGLELARIGQQDQIGTLVALSMAREMGPFITATILAAAVGSALAAELGTMAVSEELAALEVLSIDRTSFLVMPRVVSLAILCPVLTILCNTIGIIERGRLLFSGPIEEAKRRLGAQQGRVFRVRVVEEGEDGRSTTALADQFRGHPDVAAMKPGAPGEVFVRLRDGVEDTSFLARDVVRAGLRLVHLAESEMSLEDVFLHVTKGHVA